MGGGELAEGGGPDGGAGVLRRDDLVKHPAASRERRLELLVVDDRAFDAWEGPGTGRAVAADDNEYGAGRETVARNDDAITPAPEHPR